MTVDWRKSDGLVPAVIQDADSGTVLMVGYMNEESLAKTRETGKVTFFSRSREKLWTKGETSGNFLNFVSAKIDCDGDALLVQARPQGPVCHLGTRTCFGEDKPNTTDGLAFLNELTSVIAGRFESPDESVSYVAKLIKAGADRMAQKVGEEAVETVIASKNSDLATLENEAADLLFHLMVLLRSKGSSLREITRVLEGRHRP
jgi:phosphoribosyl-ATP pyrophosphohydrolase/phosphoribosyl-AMP cyclohydrolase